MLEENTYNYPRFKASFYAEKGFAGPKSGDSFIDFALFNIDGEYVDLKRYLGKWVVLETGSITCPQYVANIPLVKQLQEKYPQVVFLLLYVREAHPGNKITNHHSVEEKRQRALLAQGFGEFRHALIDDLQGTFHTSLGGKPNMVYILNPKHQVVFRSDWNIPSTIEKILEKADPSFFITKEHNEPKLASPLLSLKVVSQAGFMALWDLFIGLPQILWLHLNKQNK